MIMKTQIKDEIPQVFLQLSDWSFIAAFVKKLKICAMFYCKDDHISKNKRVLIDFFPEFIVKDFHFEIRQGYSVG